MTDTQHGKGEADSLAGYVGSWTLDPATTTVRFQTKAMWVLPVKGSFKAREGSAIVTAAGGVSGAFVIDASSVDTGMSKRDEHLRTADFFDVAKTPTFVYAVTGAKPAADGKFTLSGDFTVAGRTHPLDVLATVVSTGSALTVSAEGDLDRTVWGLNWTKMGAGVKTHLIVTAVFTKAPAA